MLRFFLLVGSAFGLGSIFGGDGNSVFNFGDSVKGTKKGEGFYFLYIIGVFAALGAAWYIWNKSKKLRKKSHG